MVIISLTVCCSMWFSSSCYYYCTVSDDALCCLVLCCVTGTSTTMTTSRLKATTRDSYRKDDDHTCLTNSDTGEGVSSPFRLLQIRQKPIHADLDFVVVFEDMDRVLYVLLLSLSTISRFDDDICIVTEDNAAERETNTSRMGRKWRQTSEDII